MMQTVIPRVEVRTIGSIVVVGLLVDDGTESPPFIALGGGADVVEAARHGVNFATALVGAIVLAAERN